MYLLKLEGLASSNEFVFKSVVGFVHIEVTIIIVKVDFLEKGT